MLNTVILVLNNGWYNCWIKSVCFNVS